MRVGNGLGIERTTRLLSGSIWNELSQLVESHRNHVSAAIAYVGTQGNKTLPLGRGSSIVVNASRRAVAAGSTDPNTLLAWFKDGVMVYSHPKLHAKVVLFEPEKQEPFAVVGSGNASGASATLWSEAALMTDSADSVEEVRGYLVSVKSDATRLSRTDLEELAKIYGTERNDSGVDDANEDEDPELNESTEVQAERVFQLFPALMFEGDDVSAEADHVAEELAAEHGAATDNSEQPGERFLYTFHNELFDGQSAHLAEGMHVAPVMVTRKGRRRTDSEVHPPARVIHRIIDRDVSPQRVYYFVLGRKSIHEPLLKDLRDVMDDLGVTLDHQAGYTRPQVLRAILSLWPDLTHLTTHRST
ncbi:phosphatidylserine/phosphatidylglycerophosphate/cardiolipin synthase family protein [Rhodococcus sp. BP-316]|uniref:phosphatidylserine/phosphatidylglycerophosphate/ cardiolipin synthase family protein n=1 Tax=Rhodococcus sp. BP-316 TaxID=2739445 RepID=UPI001C9ACC1A|nr:phosphatidylserine/phosphatidylglycerophosphate/cardiolipin synthase family protein [Rhodococcus sp. BP-316]MBY6682323.1 phosphatidylserine/phosphatidylglycerophosphate/cardiolipin synthase family protein [Rhodococcus sp. BP-316]